MSEAGVDLSQIRGDWDFHMNFLANAVTNTMTRQVSSWEALQPQVNDDAINQAISGQAGLWLKITENQDDKWSVRITGELIPQFIQACRDGFSACDTLIVDGDPEDLLLEEFTEAARQVRGLCDDLEMMREQAPGS